MILETVQHIMVIGLIGLLHYWILTEMLALILRYKKQV